MRLISLVLLGRKPASVSVIACRKECILGETFSLRLMKFQIMLSKLVLFFIYVFFLAGFETLDKNSVFTSGAGVLTLLAGKEISSKIGRAHV
jgi:hypothetical protein